MTPNAQRSRLKLNIAAVVCRAAFGTEGKPVLHQVYSGGNSSCRESDSLCGKVVFVEMLVQAACRVQPTSKDIPGARVLPSRKCNQLAAYLDDGAVVRHSKPVISSDRFY